eukprot:470127-Rhodomonas_salina.1
MDSSCMRDGRIAPSVRQPAWQFGPMTQGVHDSSSVVLAAGVLTSTTPATAATARTRASAPHFVDAIVRGGWWLFDT